MLFFSDFWPILTKKSKFYMGNFHFFNNNDIKSIPVYRVVCVEQKSQSLHFPQTYRILVMND